MDNRICNKCKAKMAKKGTLDSGNSTYQLWKCDKCNNESMQALKVNA